MDDEIRQDGFEEQGYFWLPGNSGHKVPGMLRFVRGKGSTLSLIGDISDSIDGVLPDIRDLPRILGEGERKLFTLIGCRIIRQNFSFFGQGFGQMHLGVEQVIEGALIEGGDEVLVDTMTAQFRLLPAWLEANRLRVSIAWGNNNRPDEVKFEGEYLPDESCKILGGTLTIRNRVNYTPRGFDNYDVKRDFDVHLSYETPVALKEALRLMGSFQDILTFGVDRLAAYRSVKFGHPDIALRLEGRDPIRQNAAFYVNWSTRDDEKPLPQLHELCFSYSDIGGIGGVASLTKTLQKYSYPVAKIAGTRYGKSYTQEVLLARVASLEAFHKTAHPGKKVRDARSKKMRQMHVKERMVELVSAGGSEFRAAFGEGAIGNARIEAWLTSLLKRRHAAAHALNFDPESNIIEAYHVSEMSYWLFLLLILRDANMPEDAITRLTRSPRFSFSAEQIRLIF